MHQEAINMGLPVNILPMSLDRSLSQVVKPMQPQLLRGQSASKTRNKIFFPCNYFLPRESDHPSSRTVSWEFP